VGGGSSGISDMARSSSDMSFDASMPLGDPLHCGASNVDCTAFPNVDAQKVTCQAGACVLASACLPVWADCNGTLSDGCETSLDDKTHCGDCTTSCGVGLPVCTSFGGGAGCTVNCDINSGFVSCGGGCVRWSDDPQHCGSCDPCPTIPHAKPLCISSQCIQACNPGFDFVNGNCVAHTTLGWIQESTAPFTPALFAIWGSGPKDIWAGGSDGFGGGVIYHSDGTSHWALQAGAGAPIASIWGSGPNDVFAVSESGILHWIGDGMWHSVGTNDVKKHAFLAVWGTSPDDVWTTGDGTLFHLSHTSYGLVFAATQAADSLAAACVAANTRP
jgi:hypothetical protein